MSDLTQSGPTLLLGLINAANPNLPNGPLTAGNVTLGAPSSNVGANNTQVTVTGVTGQGYSGTETFTYNRLDIGAMFTGWGKTATLTGGAAFHQTTDLLAPLNAAYDLDLQPSDVVNETLTGTVPYSYTLKMAADSLTYLNQVNVQIDA